MPIFDVIVTGMANKRTLTVLAHHLAQKPGVSLQKAQSMLARLPVIYDEGVPDIQAKDTVARLAKMGVTATIRTAVPVMPGNNAAPGRAEPVGKSKGAPPARPVVIAPHPVVKVPAVDVAGRLERLNVAALRDNRPHQRKRIDVSAIVLVGSILMTALVLVVIGVTRSRGMRDQEISLVGGLKPGDADYHATSDTPGKKTTKSGTPPSHNGKDPRTPVTEEKKAESQTYVDSAESAASDPSAAVRFFKMAISINPRNIDAWYGLMNAYSAAAMPEEAQETRLRMIELFGEAATTVSEVMKGYGPVHDASLTDEGTYRIEYRTRRSGESQLKEEAFRLSKALRVSCQCSALSLFASQGRGKGLLVHLPMDNFPQSYDDFVVMATIRYLE